MPAGTDDKTRMTGCSSTATLTALAEGRLDGRKRDRVQAHLGGCARCSTALSRIEGAREAMRTMAEWSPPPAPAASNARLEATLRWTRIDSLVETSQRPRLGAWTPRRISYYAAAAAAAALSVAGWSAVRHGGSPVPVEIARPAPAPAPAPAPPPPVVTPIELHEAVVTLVSGPVHLLSLDGREQPVDPGRTLHEGDRIVSGSDGRLAFQWGEGSGALLESGGDLRLTRLLPRSQELGIARGHISVRVGPHQPGESMRVRSPDHDVTVHGTWFIVGVQPRGGTSVEVLEGVVEVSSSSGDAASTRLPAPSRATFHRGSGIADDNRSLTGREAGALRTRTEMGLLGWTGIPALLEGNGLLHVTSDPPSQLVVDGVPFGTTPLDLRRPRGRHLVELSRAGFATVRNWISVDGESSGEWRAAMAREEIRADVIPPTSQELKDVISGSQRRQQACLERVLKRDPNLAGTVTLELRIGPAGQVLGTRVSDDTLKEPQVTDCLRKEAAGWLFEKARNATVVYPVVLHAKVPPPRQ